MARGVPPRVLVAAQWVVLVAGVGGFIVAGPRGRDHVFEDGVEQLRCRHGLRGSGHLAGRCTEARMPGTRLPSADGPELLGAR